MFVLFLLNTVRHWCGTSVLFLASLENFNNKSESQPTKNWKRKVKNKNWKKNFYSKVYRKFTVTMEKIETIYNILFIKKKKKMKKFQGKKFKWTQSECENRKVRPKREEKIHIFKMNFLWQQEQIYSHYFVYATRKG